MRIRTVVTCLTAVALLVGCGPQQTDDGLDTGASPDDDAPEDGVDPDEREPLPDDEVHKEPEPDGQPPEDPWEDFDADAHREEAEALLGVQEIDLTESAEVRIVRRGDEDFPVTMDLRPGRKNVELDEEGGRYVVTRVTVETPPDEDPIVVE